ncbi:BUD13 homolog [Cucurbita pepo subsp. pepo]|uniref:BUD13 homolog n=1 Tax=Cucurbita pepo subsp. pepo TaxID=3664 RepID=UPI000C9D6073|nr:BUD13 homolog [Cucurbita pepo subsp. pepo]
MSEKLKSLKEYLKRYETNTDEDKKKKKKKKRAATATKPNALGVLVVDEDPVWQKQIVIEEDSAHNSTDEEPQVDEDIEVKRMRRLEEVKAKRPYNSISEDGSGWVSLPPNPENSNVVSSDISPPRRTRARNDTPSPSHELKPPGEEAEDISPPRRRQRKHPISLEHDEKPTSSTYPSSDSSPPRKQNVYRGTQLQGANSGHLDRAQEDIDLSPPRQRRKRYHTPSPEPDGKPTQPFSPQSDMSPPRRVDRQASKSSLGVNHKAAGLSDLSPPRRRTSNYAEDAYVSRGSDLSPPRKQRIDVRGDRLLTENNSQHVVTDASQELQPDLSPQRKKHKVPPVSVSFKQPRKTGLLTQQEFGEEMSKTNKEDWTRFKEMNPSASSNAEPIYRDKIKGDRISKEEFLKSRGKIEEKPKEIKLEWGKGLAQKREAEAEQMELELEKDRPFARSRNDAELDSMLRERLRWGDPMAHLVKKKQSEMALPDLGDSEKMKESGFIIPQDIPPHSWLKRGLDAAPNRYGIRPGRHWDGVDRSNGFEKQMFKKMNEKRATEREAYLWSVSDM